VAERTEELEREIVERRRAEDASATFASVVKSSNDAVVTKTLEGKITSWNAAAERMFGYSAAEIIGHHITELIPEERRDEEVEIIRKIARGELVTHYETIRRRKDGSTFDISLSISPILDSRGRIIGASKVARDISDRKATEAAIRQLNSSSRSASASGPARCRTRSASSNRSRTRWRTTCVRRCGPSTSWARC
jgi:PAS domain S-box-containing protein